MNWATAINLTWSVPSSSPCAASLPLSSVFSFPCPSWKVKTDHLWTHLYVNCRILDWCILSLNTSKFSRNQWLWKSSCPKAFASSRLAPGNFFLLFLFLLQPVVWGFHSYLGGAAVTRMNRSFKTIGNMMTTHRRHSVSSVAYGGYMTSVVLHVLSNHGLFVHPSSFHL